MEFLVGILAGLVIAFAYTRIAGIDINPSSGGKDGEDQERK